MSLIKSNYPTGVALTDFFNDDWWKTRFGLENWTPAINVVDNDKNYEIEIAAPGFKKDEFHVNIENGMLMITGETQKEEEEKEKNYTRKEFNYKSFNKRFTLPEDADQDSVEAKYKDGILRLCLNKMETALPPKKEVAIH